VARTEELRRGGVQQARLCRDNGSPTYAAVIDALVADLPGGSGHRAAGAATLLLLDDPGDVVGSALYLRLLGAVHRIALGDPSCPLRAFLPSTGGKVDPDHAVAAFFDLVADRRAAVATAMRAPVQTNEVGRAVPLSAGMNAVAAKGPSRLRLLEVGAAGGLNLQLDRFRVEAGAAGWGPRDSPLLLRGQLVEGNPPVGPFSVADRRGCDLDPVDVANPAGRLLLRSFVWPEDTARLRRLDAAIATVADAGPVPVDRADAVEWVRQQLAQLPPDVTTVVFHSVVMPYLGQDQRAELAGAVQTAGSAATPDRPLAWLALEPAPHLQDLELVCRRWPGGKRVRLATCSPHGDGMRWAPVVLS
jgi:hypothetical protein